MKRMHRWFYIFLLVGAGTGPVGAQEKTPRSQTSVPTTNIAAQRLEMAETRLPSPQGFQEHVVEGKLTLSLNDAIRLALANNTNIRLEHTQIEMAGFALINSKSPFDPAFASSFNAFRFLTPQYTQLGGAPTLSQLTQTTQMGITQTLETGTDYQVSFNANKFSSNSSYNIFNPAISTNLSLTFTQPLLKGAGLYINRAPIVIAQRNLRLSRDNFEEQVNDTVLLVVANYWNVVQARENLKVQQESMDAAQKSYDHDKKSLELGALPPLDIYRSESQVASRKVSVIQAEYALKEAEDQFRQIIGADIDPNIRAYDLDLTEKAEPSDVLMTIDIPTALERAMNYRPEVDSVQQQLANDETSIRLARNSRLPNLSLSGTYQTNGLGGSPLTGLGDSLSQTFTGEFPGYGFTVSLAMPIRNHAAEAALGTSLAAKRHDLYSARQLREQIILNVTNAVHQLEQAKESVAAAKIAVDLSQKTLQADQHKYELGAETIFFVLEAQTELTEAQQTLLQAEVGYQDAVAQVDHETGGLLDRYRVQIEGISR
jgi:outer membrane protein